MGCDTPHTAICRGDYWEVPWLPGRKLTKKAAISAMSLADEVKVNGASTSGRNWPIIAALAADLGMSGSDAVAALLGMQVPEARRR